MKIEFLVLFSTKYKHSYSNDTLGRSCATRSSQTVLRTVTDTREKLIWFNTDIELSFHQFNFYDQKTEIDLVTSEIIEWFKKIESYTIINIHYVFILLLSVIFDERKNASSCRYEEVFLFIDN